MGQRSEKAISSTLYLFGVVGRTFVIEWYMSYSGSLSTSSISAQVQHVLVADWVEHQALRLRMPLANWIFQNPQGQWQPPTALLRCLKVLRELRKVLWNCCRCDIDLGQKEHETICIEILATLPETNIAPANRPSQKKTSIPTIHFQVGAVSFREATNLYGQLGNFIRSNLKAAKVFHNPISQHALGDQLIVLEQKLCPHSDSMETNQLPQHPLHKNKNKI